MWIPASMCVHMYICVHMLFCFYKCFLFDGVAPGHGKDFIQCKKMHRKSQCPKWLTSGMVEEGLPKITSA